MAEHQAPMVFTDAGTLEGRWDGRVATFLGIPYAEPPVGDRRWAPPIPAQPWEGTRRAVEHGPVAPQPPARLAAAMGPMEAPDAAEDCLSLNVWSPAPRSEERLPVLVFIHGGGYLSNAGSAAWYDGGALAARGPAVVVTINYRLGALGYLYLPPRVTGGPPIANLGLQDQALATAWVHANAAAFGGDPDRITVVGQSGGGHSIVALRSMDGAEPTFARAVLQSAPLGMPAAPAEAAEEITAVFMKAAGASELAELRALPLPAVMDAQRATLMQTAVPGRIEPPFHLVVDGAVLAEDPIVAGGAASLDGLDLLVGFTSEEARAFLAFDDALWGLDRSVLVENVRRQQGDIAAGALERYADGAPDEPGAAALAALAGDRLFIARTVALAERHAAAGGSVHLYRFSWRSDALGGRLGACHTIELPFVFANPEAWAGAPMLGDADPAALADLRAVTQDAWLAFASTGSPAHPGLPDWPACTDGETPAMDLGDAPHVVPDPVDGRRALWGPPAPARQG
jgi:para-nitrobenzyl esterase